MKAMRRRLALQKHSVRNDIRCRFRHRDSSPRNESVRWRTLGVCCPPAVCGRPRVAFATVALSPFASLPRFFRGARRSAGSGEVVAGIFAGSDGGFYAYHASTPARVVLLLRSSIAGHFLPVEGMHSGPATPEGDFLPPAVQARSHCSLLPRRLVDVGLPPAVVDMLRNLQPALQSMRWPFAGHNESVPGLLSAVRRKNF